MVLMTEERLEQLKELSLVQLKELLKEFRLDC